MRGLADKIRRHAAHARQHTCFQTASSFIKVKSLDPHDLKSILLPQKLRQQRTQQQRLDSSRLSFLQAGKALTICLFL
jgi:hypothetical protein